MENKDKPKNYIQENIKKEIDKMLSFGSVGLGINRVEEDNTAKTRLEEDISKERT
ncbi:hypothetical protein [Clostridium sp. DJ247]|uniref:hypothetical protein n=1 Tax=Clostridium sp. DJ247 TaxID=2726188 RepID=UPI00162624A8|nr:hypothetical protein [Clostridium sp. DJ247]MBC2582377.1 hypothetical protein [Clostridium sp. DJ247]